MTHDELGALAEEVRVMSGYGKTGEAISALAVGALALLDEIDALRAARDQYQAIAGRLEAERDRYREALEEIADALPSNGSITVRSIISRALSETGEQK